MSSLPTRTHKCGIHRGFPMGPNFGGFLGRLRVHGTHVTPGIGWDIRTPGTGHSLPSLCAPEMVLQGVCVCVCVRLCSGCANCALGMKVMRAESKH